MADTLVFGEVENPEEEFAEAEAAEPIEFTVMAYDAKTLKARPFKFRGRANEPTGAWIETLASANQRGSIAIPAAARFMLAVIVDEDRELFIELMNNEDLHVKASTLAEITKHFTRLYAGGRPTPPRSVRRNGPRPTGRTSKAGSAVTTARARGTQTSR
jgi:hypothetical protein